MKKHQIRLNVFMAGTLSALMIGLLSLFGLLTYHYFRMTLQNSILSTMDGAVLNYSSSVSDLMMRVHSCMALFSDEQNDTLDALLYDGDNKYESYQRYERIRDKIDNYLSVIVSSAAAKSSITFIVDDSMPIASICAKYRPENIFGTANQSQSSVRISRSTYFEEEQFYKQTSEQSGTMVYFASPEQPGILYAAQAVSQTALKYSRVQNYELGVMLIGFDMNCIDAQLSENELLQGASVCIAAGDKIVYSTGAACDGIDELNLAEEGSRSICTLNGEGFFRWTQRLDDALYITTLIPSAHINGMMYESLRMVIVEMVIMLLVLLGATVLLLRHLLSPIDHLSRHMRQDKFDSVEVPSLARRITEMGTLYDNFNDRNDRIVRLMNDIRRIEREKREQEFKLLQAQINPHFVYNTLDSVSCMALIAGNDDIAGALSALAAIMRYNLKRPDELVSFSTELEIIKSYLDIQAIRYAGEVSVHYDLDERTWACQMPKMSVQPLIENAIIHVLGEPKIAVLSRVEGNKAVITVSSEGDDGDVALIMRHLQGDIELVGRSTGLGIRNVNQRIRMVFGEGYGLHYERSGVFLKAVLTLPYSVPSYPHKREPEK